MDADRTLGERASGHMETQGPFWKISGSIISARRQVPVWIGYRRSRRCGRDSSSGVRFIERSRHRASDHDQYAFAWMSPGEVVGRVAFGFYERVRVTPNLWVGRPTVFGLKGVADAAQQDAVLFLGQRARRRPRGGWPGAGEHQQCERRYKSQFQRALLHSRCNDQDVIGFAVIVNHNLCICSFWRAGLATLRLTLPRPAHIPAPSFGPAPSAGLFVLA